MQCHLTGHRSGFPQGFTQITRFDDKDDPTRISFGVLRMRGGETMSVDALSLIHI